MVQQFCTVCGQKLADGVKFCESCGAPVEQAPAAAPAPFPQPAAPVMAPAPAPAGSPASAPAGGNKLPLLIIGGIVVVLIIAAAAVFVVLPKMQDGSLPSPFATPTPTPTPVPTPEPTVVTTVPTPVPTPTPTPDPFPNAFKLKEVFSYNEGKYASRATVYRYWIGDTYQWHNDMDNKYYEQKPKSSANKYLFVFINIENIGKDGYPYPKASSIIVSNNGQSYYSDPTHYLPNKASDRDATPVEVKEVEQYSDYFNQEYVEDYGYSHGTTQDFVYPGQGNAIDGYLIFEVPKTLQPQDTYVDIQFDGQDRAAWKLA
ncbi:MAG: zinc ribbon domain-containing protein [Methanomicrobiales archaeon]|nr:zinc ribbon domain-containing protein [Methanomicrobiales archaeon]